MRNFWRSHILLDRVLYFTDQALLRFVSILHIQSLTCSWVSPWGGVKTAKDWPAALAISFASCNRFPSAIPKLWKKTKNQTNAKTTGKCFIWWLEDRNRFCTCVRKLRFDWLSPWVEGHTPAVDQHNYCCVSPWFRQSAKGRAAFIHPVFDNADPVLCYGKLSIPG